ncbi:hypothetical protein LC593_00880 [Nostoc sp. CHAB 5844]|nr:hypothetical protein [Nostoc sp. CHAB 5844]
MSLFIGKVAILVIWVRCVFASSDESSGDRIILGLTHTLRILGVLGALASGLTKARFDKLSFVAIFA